MRRSCLVVAAALFAACATSPPLSRTTEVPVEITDHLLFVPVAVGNHPPSSFILDSGAQISVLEKRTAAASGLFTRERGRAAGAGPAFVETSVFHDVDLQLPDIAIQLPQVMAFPLTPLSLEVGRPIDGLLGRDVIERYVVEVDYERRLLRFHDPATYVVPPDAVAVPVTFDGGRAVVAAKLTLTDGRSVAMRMLVDTAASGIAVSRPFAAKQRIYDAIAPAIDGPMAVGVGGVAQQRIGRAKQFAFAGFTFDAPIVSATVSRAGGVDRRENDGLLGASVLRRFTVTFDYAHRRLLLVPNGALGEPFEADMSGAGVMAADMNFDRIRVRYVLPNSPAAEAGLQEGDEIVSIDGHSAAGLKVDGIHALFEQPGKRYLLRIRRGGRELDVAIVTRRLV